MAAPTSPPLVHALMSARRSMAWLTASRTLTLSKGGFLMFMMMLLLTFS